MSWKKKLWFFCRFLNKTRKSVTVASSLNCQEFALAKGLVKIGLNGEYLEWRGIRASSVSIQTQPRLFPFELRRHYVNLGLASIIDHLTLSSVCSRQCHFTSRRSCQLCLLCPKYENFVSFLRHLAERFLVSPRECVTLSIDNCYQSPTPWPYVSGNVFGSEGICLFIVWKKQEYGDGESWSLGESNNIRCLNSFISVSAISSIPHCLYQDRRRLLEVVLRQIDPFSVAHQWIDF